MLQTVSYLQAEVHVKGAQGKSNLSTWSQDSRGLGSRDREGQR